MFDLTGGPLVVLTGALAVATPLTAVLLWRRPGGRRRVREVLVSAILVVTAQLFAVATVFLVVNDQYDFYATWADLLGWTTQSTAIVTVGVTEHHAKAVVHSGPSPRGTIQKVALHGAPSGASGTTLVWLPPQYGMPRYAKTRFPVVIFLPGQPSSPTHVLHQYAFEDSAAQAVASGIISPFIAVIPPLMTNPPRDTECTDIPGGPHALGWLASEVPTGIAARYRVTPLGHRWAVMGWSTGAFCASKLVLTYPDRFSAAAAFGGYFQPLTDSTTGDLFHDNEVFRQQNSPLWLYKQHGLAGSSLLIVTGQQDHEAWTASTSMLEATRDDPHVSHITFPQGGHNYHNYRAYLLPALQWLGQRGI